MNRFLSSGSFDENHRAVTVLMTCRARDLPVLEITVRNLPQFIRCKKLIVIVPDPECAAVERKLGKKVIVIPENSFIPRMTIEQLRTLSIPGFPGAAGWYFQQFLKLQFAFTEMEDDYYLIWDADTVPLRTIRFFDCEGRMILTMAEEFHSPYFETYRRLFGRDAGREFSFIAQHIVVQKSVSREMLGVIEKHVSGAENWPWKIMKVLPQEGDNLFSEYETYGHYIKNRYPERVHFVQRRWLRELPPATGRSLPTPKELEALSTQYDYVAFERVHQGWRRIAKWGYGKFRTWTHFGKLFVGFG